jgi:hypothetical protein
LPVWAETVTESLNDLAASCDTVRMVRNVVFSEWYHQTDIIEKHTSRDYHRIRAGVQAACVFSRGCATPQKLSASHEILRDSGTHNSRRRFAHRQKRNQSMSPGAIFQVSLAATRLGAMAGRWNQTVNGVGICWRIIGRGC